MLPIAMIMRRRRRWRINWTPAQLSTALWLDAADTSTITLSGPRVSQWADKSGNGRNATQGVATNQPGWGVGRNLLLWSEEFQQASWALNAASISANQTTAPDGTLTADKLIDSVDNAAHYTAQNFTAVAATTYTFSIYAKAAERNFVGVQLGGAGFGNQGIAVNLTTGQTQLYNGATIGFATSVGGGWWRIGVTATATGTAGSPLISVDNALNGQFYAGTGTSGVFIWGAQITPSATADPYQQTTSGAQPLAVGMNSLPTLAFDGTNDVLALPNGTIPSGDSNYTMFMCMELGTLANAHFLGTAPSGGATGNWLGIISATVVGNWWVGYGVSGGVTQVGQDIYGAWYDSSLSTAYFARNGGTVLSQVQAVDRNSLTTQQWIGANGTALNQYLQGKIAEIIVIGSTISTDNQQRIEGYFAWKWGLTAKLPSNHPYKNYPPTI